MRYFVVVLLCALTACSSSSSSSGGNNGGGIVQASSGFTNANLSGGYAFAGNGISGNSAEASLGVITADGNGNITAGEFTADIGGTVCHLTSLTGTYSINTNGTGTVTVNGTLDQQSINNGCTQTQSTLALAIANGGNSIVVIGQGSQSVISYVGIKQ